MKSINLKTKIAFVTIAFACFVTILGGVHVFADEKTDTGSGLSGQSYNQFIQKQFLDGAADAGWRKEKDAASTTPRPC